MAMIQEKIRSLFAPKVVAPSVTPKKAERVIKLRASVKAGSSVNTINPMMIEVDPVVGSQLSYKIPAGETWIIDDLYVNDTQPVNGHVKILKNMREEVLPLSPAINDMNIQYHSRRTISPLTFRQFEDITAYFIQTEAGKTEDKTVEVIAHVTIYY